MTPFHLISFVALIVREILGGPKIPKLGHVTFTWRLLSQFCIFFVRTLRHPSPCQIWSF